jgi:hypothetical protein
MTPTEQAMVELLARKAEVTGFTATYRWLIAAVELLLRHQIELARRD